MKHINNYLPVVFCLIALTVFGAIIYKHETHIKHGKDIYIRLAPTDPRSLIQGDYMTLGHDFYFTKNTDDLYAYGERFYEHYQDRTHVLIWVLTNDKNMVIKSRFDKSEFNKDEQSQLRPLIINNPNNYVFNFYSASSSFLFAEGLGNCYEKATFAHQKTDDKGNPILVDLVDDELESLGCETVH